MDSEGGIAGTPTKITEFRSSGCSTIDTGTYLRSPKDQNDNFIAQFKNTSIGGDPIITGFRVFLLAKDDSAFGSPTQVYLGITNGAGSDLTGSGLGDVNASSGAYSTSVFEWRSVYIPVTGANAGKKWSAYWVNQYVYYETNTDIASGTTHYFKGAEIYIKPCWGGATS